MAHYVIGDVQGCFSELDKLTKKIKFNPDKDKLIFAGDLVNRGTQSLEVMDFCMKHKKSISSVLGNHDFYLLYLIEHKKKNKSLNKIVESKNVMEFHSWLKSLPLLLEIKIIFDLSFFTFSKIFTVLKKLLSITFAIFLLEISTDGSAEQSIIKSALNLTFFIELNFPKFILLL